MRVASVALVITTLVAAASAVGSSAEPAASRVIDRTLSCSVGQFAGIREAEVGASSGTRLFEDRSKWLSLADARVGDSYGSFASVSAGNPLAPDRSGFVFDAWRLSIRADAACRRAARIPLSRAGLIGGPTGQLGDDYNCVAGQRVLVRVRAIFRAPTTLRRAVEPNGRRYERAAGTITRGHLAVRSVAGKPLAYAEIFESGLARLFTARSCVAD